MFCAFYNNIEIEEWYVLHVPLTENFCPFQMLTSCHVEKKKKRNFFLHVMVKKNHPLPLRFTSTEGIVLRTHVNKIIISVPWLVPAGKLLKVFSVKNIPYGFWSVLSSTAIIENVFAFCCILYQIRNALSETLHISGSFLYGYL